MKTVRAIHEEIKNKFEKNGKIRIKIGKKRDHMDIKKQPSQSWLTDGNTDTREKEQNTVGRNLIFEIPEKLN